MPSMLMVFDHKNANDTKQDFFFFFFFGLGVWVLSSRYLKRDQIF